MSEHPRPSSAPPITWIERLISAINGAVGDRLSGSGNGLAIDMSFRDEGRPLTLSSEGVKAAHPRPTGRLCVLVHGLGCGDGVWMFPGNDEDGRGITYGHLLARDLGYTPFFLRYNSGLRVVESGAAFAALLDELIAVYPQRVREIVLLGHSMGGLVVQSAARHAAVRRRRWLELVRHVFYIGTPHDGADLERLAHVTTTVLHAVPNPITRLVGDVIDLRSQGIKDLRGGGADGGGPEGAERPSRDAGGWLGRARHHLIWGTLTDDPDHVASMIFGDGLVRHPRWHRQRVARPFTARNVRVFPGVHHLALANHPAVYEAIREWCAEA